VELASKPWDDVPLRSPGRDASFRETVLDHGQGLLGFHVDEGAREGSGDSIQNCLPVPGRDAMLAHVPHKVIDVFDRLASQYDEVLPFFAEMGAQIASAVSFVPGTQVLDLGAGTGAVTGQALDRGTRVTAIDAAPAMIGRLRREHPRAEAAVMDAHHLDFPDASFDVVVASFVVHLLDDPDAAVREVRRVLVPGGLFALTAPGKPPGSEPPGQQAPNLWTEFSQYLTPGGGMGRPLNASALLSAAGFTSAAMRPVTADLPMPGGGEMLWQWHLSHGTVAFIDGLPPDHRKEFRQRLIASTDAHGSRTLHVIATLWTARSPTA
jgi:ubiquinone/menaquinone biosynthesis C-methylase UbiE